MRAEPTQEEVLDAVRGAFPALSRQLQLGARFLVDHPEDVALCSMREIAARAGVQPVTLVRLARHLGFDGWPALRRRFVERIRGAAPSFARRAAGLIQRDDARALISETLGAVRANIEATEAGIGAGDIPAIAQTLEKAETVYVAGFRSCYAPAFSFYYAYRLFRQRTIVLVSGTGGTFETELRGLSAKDAVLLLGFDPYSREAAVVAEAAKKAGAKLVTVTDSIVSPLTRHADHVLTFSTRSPSFFPSIVAASSLLEGIVAVLLARAGATAVASVRRAESQLFALGAYLPPARGNGRERRPPPESDQ
jgi:DNA-binding MurR/RpiR family transcriptional regulator